MEIVPSWLSSLFLVLFSGSGSGGGHPQPDDNGVLHAN
jgi:hypothetical protein